MKIRSRKNKGKRLQKYVQSLLLEKTKSFGLVEGDIQNTVMGESGRDIKLSPAAETVIPFDIECKNTEKINIWSAIQQAENNCKEGRIPMVIFSKNYSKTYAVIELDKLLNLLYQK